MKKLYLILLLAYATLNADTQPVPVQQETVISPNASTQLTELAQECLDLHSTWFTPTLVTTPAEKTAILNLALTWDSAFKEAIELATQSHETILETQQEQTLNALVKQHIAVFTSFVETLKSVYCNLQLLTVGTQHTDQALVQQPLNERTLQQTLLKTCIMLTDHLMKNRSSAAFQSSISCHARQSILAYVLPASVQSSLQKPSIQTDKPNKLGFFVWHTVTFKQVVDADWTTYCPTIANLYREFMGTIHILINTAPEEKTLSNAFAKINTLIRLIAAKKQEFADPTDHATTMQFILKLLNTQMLIIKQKLTTAQQLDTLAKTNATVLPIFKKHYSLVQSPSFASLQQSLAAPDVAVVDQYVLLIEKIFTIATPSIAFCYELEDCLDNLMRIKRDYTRGLVNSWFIRGQFSGLPTLDTMITVLEQTIAIVTGKVPGSGLISYITSGQWLGQTPLKSITKDSTGSFSLEFANNLLKKIQANDLKTAGFYALISTSPFILRSLINYIKPYLDGSLGKQAETLLQEQHKQTNTTKLIDFVTQNPDIFKELTKRQPELMDQLAESVKGLVQPAPSVIA